MTFPRSSEKDLKLPNIGKASIQSLGFIWFTPVRAHPAVVNRQGKSSALF